MKQRDTLTEDEHIKLVEIGNDFWVAFSKLCEENIKKMPPELYSVTECYLGDLTSIYGRATNN